MIRERHIKSGPLLEADFYPIFSDGRRMPARAPKAKRSTAEQAKYNKTQAVKKLVRLVNANFGESDYILHPTYDPECAPRDENQARRDIVNYLRRVKTRRTSELKQTDKAIAEMKEAVKKLPENHYLEISLKELKVKRKKLSEPLKYIYVIEQQIYKSGAYAGRTNWHFHLFITGGLSAGTLESMWPGGIRTNADSFQPERFGPDAAARYMSKDPQGTKRFVCSKNLDKPVVPPPKDGMVSPRLVERWVRERIDDKDYWERRYKGYRFVKCYARYNGYNGHWYISVVMYKSFAERVRWEEPEWITE